MHSKADVEAVPKKKKVKKKKTKQGKTSKAKTSDEEEKSTQDEHDNKPAKKVPKKGKKKAGKASQDDVENADVTHTASPASEKRAKQPSRASGRPNTENQSAEEPEKLEDETEMVDLARNESAASEQRIKRLARSSPRNIKEGKSSLAGKKTTKLQSKLTKEGKKAVGGSMTSPTSTAAEHRARRQARKAKLKKKGEEKVKAGKTAKKKKATPQLGGEVEQYLFADAQQEAVDLVLGKEDKRRGIANKSKAAATAPPPTKSDSGDSSGSEYEDEEAAEEEEEVFPGAVRVSGFAEVGADDENNDVTIDVPGVEEAVNDSIVPKEKASAPEPERPNDVDELIIEAKLVDDTENGIKEVSQSERRLIEEQTRAKIFGQLGDIAQAEVIEKTDEEENMKQASFNRACIGCACLVVVLALVLGLGLGLRDNSGGTTLLDAVTPTPGPVVVPVTSAPSASPTDFPQLYYECNAKEVFRIGDSLENVGLQDFGYSISSFVPSPDGTFDPSFSSPGESTGDDSFGVPEMCVEKFGCWGSFNPGNPLACYIFGGVEFYFQGTGLPAKVTLSSSDGSPFEADDCPSALQVYELSSTSNYCGKLCISEGVEYPRTNEVTWITKQNAEYLFQVSGLYFGLEFNLKLSTNSNWDSAHGPVTPTVNTVLPGSLVGVEATASELDACGTASAVEGPTAWYIVRGNSRIITASTCGLASGWDTQISVFSASQNGGALEPNWNCINGDDNSCGILSRVVWLSDSNELYYVIVHGAAATSGDFILQLSTEGASVVAGDDCATASTINLNESVLVPLESATVDKNINEECPIEGGYFFVTAAIWHKVTGNGETLSPQLECSKSCDDAYVQIVESTGPGCASFKCVTEWWLPDCGGPSSCQWKTEIDVDYYVLVMYNGLRQPPDAGEVRLTVA